MRPESFYAENDAELRLSANVVRIDARDRQVVLAGGDRIPYDRLLLATGAEPVHLAIPGAQQPNVYVLRLPADLVVAGIGVRPRTQLCRSGRHRR